MTTTDATTQVPVFRPDVDVYTSETTVRVRADMPGVQSDALKLTLHEGVLQLDGRAAHHRFVRKIRLDWPIDAEADIEARLCEGLLTVELARAEAPPTIRRVTLRG